MQKMREQIIIRAKNYSKMETTKAMTQRINNLPSSVLSESPLGGYDSPDILNYVNNPDEEYDVRPLRVARQLFPADTEPFLQANPLAGNLPGTDERRKWMKIQVFKSAETFRDVAGRMCKRIKVRVPGSRKPFRYIFFYGKNMDQAAYFIPGECEISGATIQDENESFYWGEDSKMRKGMVDSIKSVKINNARLEFDAIENLQKCYYLACKEGNCNGAVKNYVCCRCRTRDPTAEYRFRIAVNVIPRTGNDGLENNYSAKLWGEKAESVMGISANEFHGLASTEEGENRAFEILLDALAKKYYLILAQKKGESEYTINYIKAF